MPLPPRELEPLTELLFEEEPALLLRELDTELELPPRELELLTELLFEEELALLLRELDTELELPPRELELLTELLFEEELPLRLEALLLRLDELELPTDAPLRLDTLDTTERLRFSSELTFTLRLSASREGTCTNPALRSLRLCS